jgi:hypothetical protein
MVFGDLFEQAGGRVRRVASHDETDTTKMWGLRGEMKTRLRPWIFGLLYIAAVAVLILVINFCVNGTLPHVKYFKQE